MPRTPGSQLLLLPLVAACSSVGISSTPAPQLGRDALVPHFNVDDPRVGTAGFVRETTRISETVRQTTYTLMVFAVGDTLTLGAMVEGRFSGRAVWTVGDRSFTLPLRRSDRGRTDIPVEGLAAPGEHGGFDEYDWVNVNVPLADWIDDGTPVRLVFQGPDGNVELPGPDQFFAATVVSR